MSYTAHTYAAHLASKSETRAVVNLMLSGTSSDPLGMAELNRIWWKRLAFKHFAGPRFLARQMDTMVVNIDGGVVGYLAIQYDGDIGGTFDWAVLPAMQDEGRAVLKALLAATMTQITDKQHYSHCVFGLMPGQTEVTRVLAEAGLQRLDYQLGQMVAPLPLEQGFDLPAEFLSVPKVVGPFKAQMAPLIAQDYPADYPLTAAVTALHLSVLTSGRLYSLEREGEAVGFVVVSRWRRETRLLLTLAPDLWGSDLEQQLIGALIGQLASGRGSIRLRTFSSAHLAASRPNLESLGLRWEEAPWERWVIPLAASAEAASAKAD